MRSSTGWPSLPSTFAPTWTCSAGGPGSTCSSAPRPPTRHRRPAFRSWSPLRCATRSGSTPATRSPARTCSSAAYREEGFPVTIVRPSHTYDRTLVPFDGGWTAVERMRRGKEIVVHGDGTSLWTLTHHDDFARGFVPLLGHPRTIGEAFHITSDDVLTWNQIAHDARRRGRCRGPDRACAVGRDRRASTRSGAPASLATRRTRWCSTTPSCVGVVPDYVATHPVRAGRPRDRGLARRGPGPATGRLAARCAHGPARRRLPTPPGLSVAGERRVGGGGGADCGIPDDGSDRPAGVGGRPGLLAAWLRLGAR